MGKSRKDAISKLLKEAHEEFEQLAKPERQQYAEQSPDILKRLAEQGIFVDTMGGNCPVQAEGMIGGKTKFYFRARGDSWQLHITACHKPFFNGEWQIDREYGEFPDAGWMPRIEALQFIEDGVALWRKGANAQQENK